MDDVIEEHFRKMENEESFRIFPINAVIGTQKLAEENKDRKRFSFLYKYVFPFYYLLCPFT